MEGRNSLTHRWLNVIIGIGIGIGIGVRGPRRSVWSGMCSFHGGEEQLNTQVVECDYWYWYWYWHWSPGSLTLGVVGDVFPLWREGTA